MERGGLETDWYLWPLCSLACFPGHVHCVGFEVVLSVDVNKEKKTMPGRFYSVEKREWGFKYRPISGERKGKFSTFHAAFNACQKFSAVSG